VELREGGRAGMTGRTDGFGRFSIGRRRFATYLLAASAPGFLDSPPSAPGPVIVLHRPPLVQGRAVDEGGQGVAGALVELRQPDASASWSSAADADGFFRLSPAVPAAELVLSVEADAHDLFRGSLQVERDHAFQVAAVLPRQVAFLALASDPAGLPALLDGKPMPGCPATPCQASIPVGRHQLALGDDLYVPWSRDLEAARGAQLAVSAVLERKKGTLAVTVPAAAEGELLVDGQRMASGSWSGQVPTGDHSVSFRSASAWPEVARAHVDWNGRADLSLSPAPVVPGDASAFLAGMRRYLESLGGHYSVYLRELASGRELGYRQDDVMEAASVVKLPVALFAYHQVEGGAVKLEDSVELQQADFMGGTGSLFYTAHAGDKRSLGELLNLLIRQSDNTAWRALLRVLGARAVDSYAAGLGAPHCRQGTDDCTAREAGLLLARLESGSVLNAEHTQALRQLLETTVFNDRINYYLGSTPVAHKVGMDGGVINDSGIVYLQGDPFVVSVFTTTDDPAKGVQAIRDVARAALRFYSR
jgi:beta-lactamase class A